MDQLQATRGAGPGQHTRAMGVDGVGLVRLALRLVDRGVGGCIDHDVGAGFGECPGHGRARR